MVLLAGEYTAYKKKMEAQRAELMSAVRMSRREIDRLHQVMGKEPYVAALLSHWTTDSDKQMAKFADEGLDYYSKSPSPVLQPPQVGAKMEQMFEVVGRVSKLPADEMLDHLAPGLLLSEEKIPEL